MIEGGDGAIMPITVLMLRVPISMNIMCCLCVIQQPLIPSEEVTICLFIFISNFLRDVLQILYLDRHNSRLMSLANVGSTMWRHNGHRFLDVWLLLLLNALALMKSAKGLLGAGLPAIGGERNWKSCLVNGIYPHFQIFSLIWIHSISNWDTIHLW